MRGAQDFDPEKAWHLRIIPADAGSTRFLPDGLRMNRDHPRGCGEHAPDSSGQGCDAGSSPRMRGAPCDDFQTAWFEGIIPADAGSTALGVAGAVLDTGSSPRMRGARVGLWAHFLLFGIIPADAGSTSAPKRCPAAPQDHPRGCGEHKESQVRALGVQGSSLRIRGAQVDGLMGPFEPGIIPADAGSTLAPTPGPGWTGDHPCGCGEHRQWLVCACTPSGSSLRMRGARHQDLTDILARRIIPADAGSTICMVWLRSFVQDHPCGCGEHSKCGHFIAETPGSSLRMRGALG